MDKETIEGIMGCLFILLLICLGAFWVYDKIEQNRLKGALRDLEDVCRGVSHADYPAHNDNSRIHPVVGFLPNGAITFNYAPTEARVDSAESVELVICVRERREILIETCRYEKLNTIERYMEELDVVLYEIATGEVIASETLVSTMPEACKMIEEFPLGSTSMTKAYRSSIPDSQVREWVAKYAIRN